MQGSRTIRTERAREAFLAVLRESCNVTKACRAAAIGRSAAYAWRHDDPDFAAAWEEAEQEAVDRLEGEAWRRAADGCDKPIVYRGEVMSTYKEYSDRLMEVLLKGHRPEKYVDRLRSELSGPGGGPIQLEQVTNDAADFASRMARLSERAAEGDLPGEPDA